MQIVHVISSIDAKTGGPAIALFGLAEAQRKLGMDVTVVATQSADSDLTAADALRRRGIEVELIGATGAPLQCHPRISHVLRNAAARANVFHIHGLWEEVQHQAAVAAQGRRLPYIFRPCGMLDPWSLAQSRWKKWIYLRWRLLRDLNGARALHFTSQTECDLVNPLRLKPERIVEPNGVNLAEFETLPPPGTFRSNHPEVGYDRFILFMSRLHPGKGLDLLVPAFANVAAAVPGVRLIIAGPDDDGYSAIVRQTAARCNLGDRLLLMGMLRGIERIAALAEAELFVLPSYHENFGNVVIEALAAGTPVVISDAVNIHDEISRNEVGGVVPTNQAALAAELRRWLTDRSLIESARQRAGAFVRRSYDWNEIARRWGEHYRRLTGQ